MARRKLTAKQIAAGFGGKRRKSHRHTGRKKKVRRTIATRKVRHMARKHHHKSGPRRFRISVLGTLLGLGMADVASNGAVQQLVTGNFSGAGSALKGALSNPGQSARKALPFAAGLGALALTKRYVKPGANVGPVRVEL